MHEVELSDELLASLRRYDEAALTEVATLVELLEEFGVDVINALDRLYREPIWRYGPAGSVNWVAFRIYAESKRISMLAKVNESGSITLY